MRASRSSLDLLGALALAAAGLAAALIPLPTWLRVLLLAPLVLAVSGYAVLAALFVEKKLSPPERAVYAVGLSIAVAVLGGIVVQSAIGLDRTAWAVLTAAVTAAAALLAEWRRGKHPAAALNANVRRAGPRLPLPGLLSVLSIAAAVAVAAVAIAISSAGARREAAAYQFTALWVQPTARATGAGQAVAIGVDNHQGAVERYRLVAKQGKATMTNRQLVLTDAGRYRLRLPVDPISAADPVVVSLERNGEIFRHVYLVSATAP